MPRIDLRREIRPDRAARCNMFGEGRGRNHVNLVKLQERRLCHGSAVPTGLGIQRSRRKRTRTALYAGVEHLGRITALQAAIPKVMPLYEQAR